MTQSHKFRNQLWTHIPKELTCWEKDTPRAQKIYIETKGSTNTSAISFCGTRLQSREDLTLGHRTENNSEASHTGCRQCHRNNAETSHPETVSQRAQQSHTWGTAQNNSEALSFPQGPLPPPPPPAQPHRPHDDGEAKKHRDLTSYFTDS